MTKHRQHFEEVSNMSRITRASIIKIHEALDNSYFTSASFNVVYPDSGDIFVRITFIDKEDYYFNYLPSANTVKYSPGPLLSVTSVGGVGFDTFIAHISSWINYIRSELLAINNYIFKELNELQDSFNKAINDTFVDVTSVFSREEIDHLKRSLDALSDKFQALSDDNTITKDELSKIKTTLEGLKADAENFPKKSWYRTVGNTIFKFTGKFMSSPAGQKIIEEGTMKLLESSHQ
jgi:chaperonin cofactor prefoldin